MNMVKTLITNVIDYLDRKEAEKDEAETINLLMQLTLSHSIIDAVEIKKEFDSSFLVFLAEKKIEAENNLKAINSYA